MNKEIERLLSGRGISGRNDRDWVESGHRYSFGRHRYLSINSKDGLLPRKGGASFNVSFPSETA